MTAQSHDVRLDTLEKDDVTKHHELIEVRNNEYLAEWLQRFPLIAEKSPEELKVLEKGLLRKLDWIFLPTVTMMLLLG
jgi:hypothetical protein